MLQKFDEHYLMLFSKVCSPGCYFPQKCVLVVGRGSLMQCCVQHWTLVGCVMVWIWHSLIWNLSNKLGINSPEYRKDERNRVGTMRGKKITLKKLLKTSGNSYQSSACLPKKQRCFLESPNKEGKAKWKCRWYKTEIKKDDEIFSYCPGNVFPRE